MRFHLPRRRKQDTGGRAAKKAAEKELRATRERWPDVREVASELRSHREENGWVRMVAHIYGGRE